MTFEEWWKKHMLGRGIGDSLESFLHWAWDEGAKQERERCLAACVTVQQHWSGGLAEARLPEINDRLLGIAECIEVIRKADDG